jgi:hypothetical protein
MKRCPQCSFIYEEDQRHCDLDGAELVLDAGALTPPEINAPPGALKPVRARRRRFAALPAAGVVLAAALIPVYYALPERAAPGGTAQPSAKLTGTPQPGANLLPAPTPARPLAPTHAAVTTPAAPHSAPGVKATGRAPTTVKRAPANAGPPPPTRKQVEKRAEPEAASRKKESRLGSILKKTGRYLKKPFKF